jgi:uncharacterized membrane protein YkvA (DUF1232 family)
MMERLLRWANRLKAEAVTLWFCCRHAQTPLFAKALAIGIVAYAFSPIDLIPDFIPVLGLLDEAILLPIAIWFTLKFIPQPILDECRDKAAQWLAGQNAKPRNWFGAAFMLLVWLLVLWLMWEHWGRRFFA